jgi:hypothetical protein
MCKVGPQKFSIFRPVYLISVPEDERVLAQDAAHDPIGVILRRHRHVFFNIGPVRPDPDGVALFAQDRE